MNTSAYEGQSPNLEARGDSAEFGNRLRSFLDSEVGRSLVGNIRTALLRIAIAVDGDASLLYSSKEAVLAMAVARLGGKVEGAPTHRGNFLQRIDELRRVEVGGHDELVRYTYKLHDGPTGDRLDKDAHFLSGWDAALEEVRGKLKGDKEAP